MDGRCLAADSAVPRPFRRFTAEERAPPVAFLVFEEHVVPAVRHGDMGTFLYGPYTLFDMPTMQS